MDDLQLEKNWKNIGSYHFLTTDGTALFEHLNTCYVFCRNSRHKRTVLWASVRYELFLVSSVLAVVRGDMRAHFHEEAGCVDASLSGICVCQGTLGASMVSKICQNRERWRFKQSQICEIPARIRALGAVSDLDPLKDLATARAIVEGEIFSEASVRPEFQEVPLRALQPELWRQSWNYQVKFADVIHNLECAAVLSCFRAFTRKLENRHSCYLVLSVSMCVVLAVDKGRSTDHRLLRQIRKLCALSAVSRSRLYLRWIHSERNVADKGSRQWEAERLRSSLHAASEDEAATCGPSPAYSRTQFSNGTFHAGNVQREMWVPKWEPNVSFFLLFL